MSNMTNVPNINPHPTHAIMDQIRQIAEVEAMSMLYGGQFSVSPITAMTQVSQAASRSEKKRNMLKNCD